MQWSKNCIQNYGAKFYLITTELIIGKETINCKLIHNVFRNLKDQNEDISDIVIMKYPFAKINRFHYKIITFYSLYTL